MQNQSHEVYDVLGDAENVTLEQKVHEEKCQELRLER